MLTKRTNILFDEELWQFLYSLAKRKNTSVGALVRQAVRKSYLKEEKQTRIAKAAKTILLLRKKQKNINYKKLINYGRKY